MEITTIKHLYLYLHRFFPKMFFINGCRANERPNQSPACDGTCAINGFILTLGLILKVLRVFNWMQKEQKFQHFAVSRQEQVWPLELLLVFDKHSIVIIHVKGGGVIFKGVHMWLSAENSVKTLAEKNRICFKHKCSGLFFVLHSTLLQPTRRSCFVH